MFLRHVACLSALIVGSPAWAAAPPPSKYTPGNVIVAIEGGVVGQELGNLVLALARGENLLLTRPHVIGPGDSPCLMAGRELGFPKPCSAQFLQALDILNPKLRPSSGKLSVGQTMLLPDLSVRQYRTARTLSKAVPKEQTRGVTIQKNWTHLRTGVTQKSARTDEIEFDAYELILGSADPERQKKLMERLTPFRSLNVRVTSIGFRAVAAKAYAVDPDLYQQDCRRVPPPTPRVEYRTYADTDGDLTALVSQRPPGSRPAKVFVIDVDIPSPGPNLDGAIEGRAVMRPAGSGPCAWVGRASKLQHSTHMAGIIASRDNGSGFVGLSPSSKIVPYDFLTPDSSSDTGLVITPEKNEWLADMLSENRQLNEPYLYLIATSLPDYATDAINRFALRDEQLRFDDDRPVERRIQDLRPLFVVAAGQAEEPLALSPTTPISPQNLGDLRNVLVVTACEKCARVDPHLMQDANYGMGGRYVHVAAPGGSPLIGWVDGSGVGVAHGTSQAAAYTAGVVAEMMGRWSESYRDADMVKKRVQVTSWPFFKRAGHTDEDHERLATGIVDPALALLDPRVHWIKDANGWRQIRLRKFSTDTLTFSSSETEDDVVAANAVARFVKVSERTAPPRWIVYRDLSVAGKKIDRLGEVARIGPVGLGGDVALVPCDGPPIPLADIEDLVIANTGLGKTPCAS